MAVIKKVSFSLLTIVKMEQYRSLSLIRLAGGSSNRPRPLLESAVNERRTVLDERTHK